MIVSANFGRSGAVLLVEALPADAIGMGFMVERAVGEVRQDVGRDLREVAQQVAFGERGAASARIGRPVHAIEVAELERGRRPGSWRGFGLVDQRDQLDRAPSPSSAWRYRFGGAPHLLRIDGRHAAAEHRRAQRPVAGPALEHDLRTAVG